MALLSEDVPRLVVEDVVENVLGESFKMNILMQKLLGSDTCIVPIQTDLLDAHTIAQLEFYANVIVRVRPASGEAPNSSRCARLEIRQRRPGGRIAVQHQQFDIDSAGRAVNFVTLPETGSLGQSYTPTPANDAIKASQPSSTFNLSTTNEQKNVKDSLVLPYMRMTLEEDAQEKPSGKQILAPDFDDEDPDDDLDI